MWQQVDSLSGMDWESALAYGEASELSGYSDWRLPNTKELQSILDYTRSPGTAASAAIDPVFSATQITNMAGDADYPWYWTGTTHLSFTGVDDSGSSVCFGRGMGTMDEGVTIIDVHGAGCQRSDPKSGDPADYPSSGHGPQGDVQRVFNHVRLVRDVSATSGLNPDTDGDGMTDADEQFIGSNPNDRNSVFEVSIQNTGSGDMELSWPKFNSGLQYELMGCTNLVEGSWFYIGSTKASNLTEAIDSDCVYYRVNVIGNK